MFSTARMSIGRVITALAVVALTVLATAVLPTFRATSAQASTSLRIRMSYGYRIEHGRDFVGAYRMSNGRLVYCIDPTYAEPARVSLHTKTRVPRLSTKTTTEIAEVLYAHSRVRSNWQAAVVSQALNTLVGNRRAVATRARLLPKSVGREAAKYVAEAKRAHGPYSVRVSEPTALLPGQSARGAVRVTPARAGIVVRLSSSANARVSRTVRTGANGSASFTYSVGGPGEVSIAGRALNLPPTTVLASDPQGRVQRMVTWGSASASRVASSSFEAVAAGFSHNYGCSTTCNGRPATTLQACVQRSVSPQRVVYHIAGATKTLSWGATRTPSCKSLSVSLSDGVRVTSARQYYSYGRWSAPIAIHGAFVVDCPAAPGAAASEVFSCVSNTASVTIALAAATASGGWTPTINTGTHRYVLQIAGAATQSLYADHGKTAVATFRTGCGAHKTFTFRSGVRRANGQYNYSAWATVVSP